MNKEWVLSLRDQCRRERVPFFFKQWGGVRKSENGRILNGQTYDGFPHISFCLLWQKSIANWQSQN